MHYDAVIIGAGMSGLAAGIRLAHFDKRVCVVEKHYAFGGLNSYYKLRGREFDVGLHAVTNFATHGDRSAPLAKLLRQLRLTPDDFALLPQRHSEIRFSDCRMQFTNDIEVLADEVARAFPGEADRFRSFVAIVRSFEDTRLDQPYRSAREELSVHLQDPLLIEMLLCPIMYYGSAEEHDMDFTQFVTMFKALFLEGFARPREGVRRIIKTLVRRYRTCGGTLRMRSGVDRIIIERDRVLGVELTGGETITADTVLSCAGYHETMRLCQGHDYRTPVEERGRLTFVETIAVTDKTPADLGHDATIVFFNDGRTFRYARPEEPVDLHSGVVCCPNNYEGHQDLTEGLFRLTWIAQYEAWTLPDEATYRTLKDRYRPHFLDRARQYIPAISDHIVDFDMFTPRTIERYTGHIGGAVYGSPRKRRDGRTPYGNLFICGTDQGFLGIIGAMLSGITIANLHILSEA